MAHELDIMENGRKAMFAVGGSVWHDPNNSVAINEAPSLHEAIELAGLEFEVELEPLYLRKQTDDGDEYYVQVETGHRATVRSDRGKVLGVVGSRYHALQNYDAFRALEPLLDAGLVTLETGGSLREGRDVWMLAKFNIDDPIVQEVYADEVLPYGLICNNHAGWRPAVLMNTPIRVVCANTLGFALGNKSAQVRIRHTKEVNSRMVTEARKLWDAVIERHRGAAMQYKALQERVLEEEEFKKYVLDVIAPIPERLTEAGLKKRDETTLRKLEDKRTRVTELWEGGKGHEGEHTAWEAYNAVVESLDHDDELWKVRIARTEALFPGGTLEMPKDRVFKSLLKLTK